jgi:outer membrane protein OmpA-like peptidoglycan-associated protein
MSVLQILERIYEWFSVVGLACLLSSCTLALKNNVDAFAHEEKMKAIVPASRTQQIELGGVTRFVACDERCTTPTPKTLGSMTAVATAISTPEVDAPLIVPAAYVATETQHLQVSVMFERDGITLGPGGKRALRRIRSAMQSATVIRIDGRTDDEGIQATNDKLASARALTVMLFVRDELLTSMGAGPELRATGLGKCCYVGDNKTSIGRAANRRVDVTVEARQSTSAVFKEQSAGTDAARNR